MGVTYWDTADSYGWGKNEKAIGKYFSKHPSHREKIFLVTKAATSDPKKLTEKLDTSLQRMNTSHVDMYFIHYVSDVKAELTASVSSSSVQPSSVGHPSLRIVSTLRFATVVPTANNHLANACCATRGHVIAG